ncbi:MAG: hypothetical protein JWO98_5168 [Frankiales bacterium]|nr:hypothetical protein [Frankiales bacterium]
MSCPAGPPIDDELLLQVVAEVLQPEPLSREAVAAVGRAAWIWHDTVVALDPVPRHPGPGHDDSTGPSPNARARRAGSRFSGHLGRPFLGELATLSPVKEVPAYRRLAAWLRTRWTTPARGGARARPVLPGPRYLGRRTGQGQRRPDPLPD